MVKMYDSVNFWIDRAMVGGEPFTIAQYLTDQAEHKSERGYSISGRAGDYSIFLNESGISMRGSLPKFLLPFRKSLIPQALKSPPKCLP